MTGEALGSPVINLHDRFNDKESDKMSIDLPLKSNLNLRSNFAELSDDWDSFPGAPSVFTSILPSPATSKSNLNLNSKKNSKVRFDYDNDTTYLKHERKAVEQLIESATAINDYVTDNMNKISDFRSNLLNNKSSYSNISNQSSNLDLFVRSHPGSISNFDLSEEDTSGQEDTLYNDIQSDIAFNSGDLSKFTTEQITNNEIEANLQKFSSLKITPKNNKNDEDENNILPHFLTTDDNDNRELYLKEICKIDTETSIHYFIENIETLLKLSEMHHLEDNTNDLSSFMMKSKPAVSFQDLIKRIQEKCQFDSAIFLQSSLLLQTLMIEKNNEQKLHLRNNLDVSFAHRLVISLIRISCKLFQDK